MSLLHKRRGFPLTIYSEWPGKGNWQSYCAANDPPRHPHSTPTAEIMEVISNENKTHL